MVSFDTSETKSFISRFDFLCAPIITFVCRRYEKKSEGWDKEISLYIAEKWMEFKKRAAFDKENQNKSLDTI